jgi:DHA1 family bicyclomycin/chloramphenicol resistance-like MFS transporter
MVHLILATYVVAALGFWAITAAAGGLPSFPVFMIGMVAMLSLHALLIPNFNSIAMLPMGHIAGTASAVIGTISLAGGAFLGSIIDRRFADTVSPLVVSFALFGLVALAFVAWADRGKLFARPESQLPQPRAVEPRVR